MALEQSTERGNVQKKKWFLFLWPESLILIGSRGNNIFDQFKQHWLIQYNEHNIMIILFDTQGNHHTLCLISSLELFIYITT